LAERVLGKDEVTSSILVIGSSLRLGELSLSEASARQAERGESDNAKADFRFSITGTT
jgi:hypothetical protein